MLIYDIIIFLNYLVYLLFHQLEINIIKFNSQK